jgi:hypothetical protein
MKVQKTLSAALLLLAGAALASAGSICPAGASPTPFAYNPDNAATGCNVVITIGAGGTITSSIKDNGPYDGSEDVLIGVVNNSGISIGSLQLTGNGLFGFDGDGMCTYTFVGSSYCSASQKAGTDPGDYSGPGNTFSVTNSNTGSVVFAGGLANGATTYFSAEGVPSSLGLTGGATGGGGTSVPTLGDAGLLLLAISLAGAAVWKLRGSALQS